MFSKLYFIFDKIRTVTVISLLTFIVILCLVQVILRYFTPAELTPFAWGERDHASDLNLGGVFSFKLWRS